MNNTILLVTLTFLWTFAVTFSILFYVLVGWIRKGFK